MSLILFLVPDPNYILLCWPSANELVCMMVWLGWGATNTSGRGSTRGPCALKQKYHLPSSTLFKTAMVGGIKLNRNELNSGNKNLKTFFPAFFLLNFTSFLLSCTKILLSFTSSGTKFYQIPLLTYAVQHRNAILGVVLLNMVPLLCSDPKDGQGGCGTW